MLECERCAMGVDRVLSFADALWPSFLTARARQLDHEHRARAAVVRADEYLSRNVVVSADQDHVLAAPGTDATTLAIGSRPAPGQERSHHRPAKSPIVSIAAPVGAADYAGAGRAFAPVMLPAVYRPWRIEPPFQRCP